MRWFEQDTINAAVGLNAVAVYNATSIFDPSITGGATQPRGYDQISGLYDHWTVVGCKISVDFHSSADSIVGIAVRDSVTTETALRGYQEGRNVKTMYASPTSGPKRRMIMGVNPAKFLGYPKPLSADNLRGSASANPAENVYFHVFTQSVNPLYDPGDVFLNVRMEFLVVWTEPKQVAAS